MGEMADFLIDDMMDAYPEWNPYGSVRPASSLKTCKYCGKSTLHWELTGEGWRLFGKKGKLHICDKYKKKVT